MKKEVKYQMSKNVEYKCIDCGIWKPQTNRPDHRWVLQEKENKNEKNY